MNKELFLKMFQECLESGDIRIYVNNEGDTTYETLTTTIDIHVKGESIQEYSSTGYLGRE